MTWTELVRAGWDRFDAWRARRDRRLDNDRLIQGWFGQPRMPSVEDTGSIVATPEDLAEIGPFDPVHIPGQRRGRHAREEEL